MKALLLGGIALTDRNQPATAIGGVALVVLMLCLARAWGWL
jgi:hypothetical protein